MALISATHSIPTRSGVTAMAARSSWSEKLHRTGDLPKIVEITGKMSRSWGEGLCVIPAPMEVDQQMRAARKGQIITVVEIRQALATAHQVNMACPLTTGIFCWIAAHAAVEAEESGQKKTTPWWRTLKSSGELNPKFPGGVDRQRALLESEGHIIVMKGKRWFVLEYEKKLVGRKPVRKSASRVKTSTQTEGAQ